MLRIRTPWRISDRVPSRGDQVRALGGLYVLARNDTTRDASITSCAGDPVDRATPVRAVSICPCRRLVATLRDRRRLVGDGPHDADDLPIEAKMVSKAIERARTRSR